MVSGARHGGHLRGAPLLDAIEAEGKRPLEPLPGDDQGPWWPCFLAAMPARSSRMLPLMLSTAEKFPDHRFVVAAAPAVDARFYREVIGDAPAEVIVGRTYDILRHADAALVTSGTATLERPCSECRGGLLQRQHGELLAGPSPGQGAFHLPGEPDHGHRGGAGLMG